MRFASKEQKLQWLKAAAEKIRHMEAEPNAAIMAQEFGRAYSLLRGLNYAKVQFRKVSHGLRKSCTVKVAVDRRL